MLEISWSVFSSRLDGRILPTFFLIAAVLDPVIYLLTILPSYSGGLLSSSVVQRVLISMTIKSILMHWLKLGYHASY